MKTNGRNKKCLGNEKGFFSFATENAGFPERRFLPRCRGEVTLAGVGKRWATRQELFPTRPRLRSVSPGWQINESTARPGGHAVARPTRWRTIGLMPMKVREVIRLLEKHGWVEMRSRGSHRHFKHPDEAFVITVPGSDGKELAPGTLNVILKKAGLK